MRKERAKRQGDRIVGVLQRTAQLLQAAVLQSCHKQIVPLWGFQGSIDWNCYILADATARAVQCCAYCTPLRKARPGYQRAWCWH